MQSNCVAEDRAQGMGRCMEQCGSRGTSQGTSQGRTAKAAQAKAAQKTDLLCLLSAEHRRVKRRLCPDLASGLSSGLSSVQLVVLRTAFAPGTGQEALPQARAGITGLVQECDSVIALDKETLGLFLPCATLPLARSFLKKALAILAPQKVQGLLVTIEDTAFEDLGPSEIEARIRAELKKGACRAGHIVLGGDSACDQSRVSAEERSFLLSPLS